MPQIHPHPSPLAHIRHPIAYHPQSTPLPVAMHRLPNEILQRIFDIYVHSSGDPSYSPLSLTHVCRLWRITACSYGGLWTSIRVSPHVCCPSRLRLWLERAMKYSLDIAITFPASNVFECLMFPRIHDIVKGLLLPVCAQWRSLSIEGPSNAVLSLGYIIPPFHNPSLVGLTSFSIINTDAAPGKPTPDHCDLAYSPLITLPRLRSLSLSSCRPRLNHIPEMTQLCERLAHLRLHDLVFPRNELYSLLGSCSSLESLELDDIMVTIPLDSPLMHQVVRGPNSNTNGRSSLVLELPKLKSLAVKDYMSYRYADIDSANFELTGFMLVGWLKCPQLEELKLRSGVADMSTRQSDALFQCLEISGYPAVRRLLVRGCALDMLEYATRLDNYGGKKGLRRCLNNVEELMLCEAWMSGTNLRLLGKVCPSVRVLHMCTCNGVNEEDILDFVASKVTDLRELTVAPAGQELKATIEVATKGSVQVRTFTRHAMAHFHVKHCLTQDI